MGKYRFSLLITPRARKILLAFFVRVSSNSYIYSLLILDNKTG